MLFYCLAYFTVLDEDPPLTCLLLLETVALEDWPLLEVVLTLELVEGCLLLLVVTVVLFEVELEEPDYYYCVVLSLLLLTGVEVVVLLLG